MIYSLTGTIEKLPLPQVSINVKGIGYLLTVPLPVWDSVKQGEEATLIVYTYVREDRLDLFGFRTKDDRMIFIEFLNISGIGPKTALELCSIPRSTLLLAAQNDDVTMLTKIKGVGRKTAEKLLVDLKQLLEKHPEWTVLPRSSTTESHAAFDDDAIAALRSLGYDQQTVLEALKKLPPSITKTEDRVAAALRSL